MNDIEKYEFDRSGYLVIRQLITADDAKRLSDAADDLETHACSNIDKQTRKGTAWGMETRLDTERHYHAYGQDGEGNTIVIEDFWNANPAFDVLLDHPGTLDYISSIIDGRYTINNSELRIRYTGNSTISHLGGPTSSKYRYKFTEGRIDCMMVRMIYFLHDVDADQGPFSVVPGTHKSNYNSPYGTNADEEPGMIGLPVKAGDAILFTENLRHGGLTNRSSQTRKTLHVGYGPYWMRSQNSCTREEVPYVTDATYARLTETQGNLFRALVPGQNWY